MSPSTRQAVQPQHLREDHAVRGVVGDGVDHLVRALAHEHGLPAADHLHDGVVVGIGLRGMAHAVPQHLLLLGIHMRAGDAPGAPVRLHLVDQAVVRQPGDGQAHELGERRLVVQRVVQHHPHLGQERGAALRLLGGGAGLALAAQQLAVGGVGAAAVGVLAAPRQLGRRQGGQLVQGRAVVPRLVAAGAVQHHQAADGLAVLAPDGHRGHRVQRVVVLALPPVRVHAVRRQQHVTLHAELQEQGGGRVQQRAGQPGDAGKGLGRGGRLHGHGEFRSCG
jgi:hypothetical protein